MRDQLGKPGRKESFLRVFILVSLSILHPFRGLAQDLSLFESNEVLEVRIKTDIKHLMRMSRDDKYQKAKLLIGDQSWKIRVRPRGNNRFETCSFPPITLNFSKTEFSDSSYYQLKKLKLVNSCKLHIMYEQYVLREYMIYRMLNLLTDFSFKVRLLKIEYQDAKENKKPIVRYGFVIEDQNMLARRHNGFILKQQGLKDEYMNREQMVLVSVFQFMIGNADWQVPALQNLKLIKMMDINEADPYVVPYDFDYAGLVNASYAIPAEILGIESVTERLYRGQCYSEEELRKVFDLLIDRKDEIYELYHSFELFDKKSINHSINYLDSFYEMLDKEKVWKLHLMKECK